MADANVPETFWLVNCGATQFTIAQDPTPDIRQARDQGAPFVTLDDVYGGETTLVVDKIEAWWLETPEVRAKAYRFRKFLRDEEKAETGFDGDDD